MITVEKTETGKFFVNAKVRKGIFRSNTYVARGRVTQLAKLAETAEYPFPKQFWVKQATETEEIAPTETARRPEFIAFARRSGSGFRIALQKINENRVKTTVAEHRHVFTDKAKAEETAKMIEEKINKGGRLMMQHWEPK